MDAISQFMRTYPHLGYLAGAALLTLSGLGLTRLYRNPVAPISSWFVALLLFVFGTAGPSPILALAGFVAGLVLIVKYYKRHRRP